MTIEPNSPLELDAVMYALSRGEQASFVPRLRATFAAKDAEIERLRAALEEIAGCPNEGPFLRRLARRALGGGR